MPSPKHNEVYAGFYKKKKKLHGHFKCQKHFLIFILEQHIHRFR